MSRKLVHGCFGTWFFGGIIVAAIMGAFSSTGGIIGTIIALVVIGSLWFTVASSSKPLPAPKSCPRCGYILKVEVHSCPQCGVELI